MKNTVYILLLFVAVIACGKKENAVSPDAATQIAGTYDAVKMESVASGSGQSMVLTFPYTDVIGGMSMTQTAYFVVTRKTASSVGIMSTFKATGMADDVRDLGTFDVKGNDLYSGSTKVGTADGSTMVVSSTEYGARRTVTAKKR